MKLLFLLFGLWVSFGLFAQYQSDTSDIIPLAMLGVLFFGGYKLLEKEKLL
jgi:hypothetical protein